MAAFTEDPSLDELITLGIDAHMDRVFKACPGIVRLYDPITNTAFVQPAVKQARYDVDDDERTHVALPEIPFVPVVFPRAGGFVLRMPVKDGDSVLLVFCDSSLAEWRTSGGLAEPQDARRHSPGWPVAIPGFFPDSSPLSPLDAILVAAGAMIVGQDGGKQMRVTSSGVEFAPAGVSAVSPVALSVPVVAALNAIKTYLAALTSAFATAASGSIDPAFAAMATGMAAPGATVATALSGVGTAVPSTMTKSL